MSEAIEFEKTRVPMSSVLKWIAGTVVVTVTVMGTWYTLSLEIARVEKAFDARLAQIERGQDRFVDKSASLLERVENLEDNVVWRRGDE